MSNFLDSERPANPLQALLSNSLKKSSDTPLSLLSSTKLKTSYLQPKDFLSYDLSFDSSYTPSTFLRFLDKLKNYSPSQVEVDEFSLNSNQRYSLYNIKMLLILCGGLIGNSFTSSEMNFAHNFNSLFIKNYTNLENVFHSLSATEKKIKNSVLQDLLLSPVQECDPVKESLPEELPTLSKERLESIQKFFNLAREILSQLLSLQSFIKEKRHQFNRVEKITNGSINPDPEKTIGSLYPLWFNTLYSMWEKSENLLEEHEANKSTLSNDFKSLKVHPSFTLKKFSYFIKKAKTSFKLSESEQEALFHIDSAAFSSLSPPETNDLPSDISAYFYFFISVPEIRKFNRD